MKQFYITFHHNKWLSTPDGINAYDFEFKYGFLSYSETLLSKLSPEKALESLVQKLQWELMHAGLELMNWKENTEIG